MKVKKFQIIFKTFVLLVSIFNQHIYKPYIYVIILENLQA